MFSCLQILEAFLWFVLITLLNVTRIILTLSGSMLLSCLFGFFFSSRRRHTRFDCDWSSDVCSSDLRTLEAMRSSPRLVLFTLAAACWLFAGPGGATARALLACRHHATHHAAGGHHTVPSDGPCFCDEMTGGSDLALSVAVAEPPPPSPPIRTPEPMLLYPSLFPFPPSPSFSPTTPPPNGLG